MKKIFDGSPVLSRMVLLCLACLCLFACEKSDDSGDSFNPKQRVQLEKLDLNNAKYLSLTGALSRADGDDEVGLFKIDETGKVSTVLLSCSVEEDGQVTKTVNNISVKPHGLYTLSDKYLLLTDCQFLNENGEFVDMHRYYEPENPYFNILVQKSDGKIYYIPQSANEYFTFNEQTFKDCVISDNRGNVYIPSNNRNLGMLTLVNGELAIKQVNPNGVPAGYEPYWVLDNGTIIQPHGNNIWTFFYPNGGFEEYVSIQGDEEEVYPCQVGDKIMAARLKRKRSETLPTEYILSLHEFHLGTSLGSYTLSEPIATISSGTDYSKESGDANYMGWVDAASRGLDALMPIWENSSAYILGQHLMIDKQKYEFAPLQLKKGGSVICPTKDNVYKGRTWEVSQSDSRWFNIETLDWGVIPFDLSAAGDWMINDFQASIPSGKAILTGVRKNDGKQVICEVNIETGQATCMVAESSRPMTVFVPLN